MNEEIVDNNQYAPYKEEYVADLLKIVGGDIQENAPISDEDYLKLALQACRDFNRELGDQSFDVEA